MADGFMARYMRHKREKERDRLIKENNELLREKRNNKVDKDRRCPNCGRIIPFDAKLCPYCGKKFEDIKKDLED